jgi:hypothetical protein
MDFQVQGYQALESILSLEREHSLSRERAFSREQSLESNTAVLESIKISARDSKGKNNSLARACVVYIG